MYIKYINYIMYIKYIKYIKHIEYIKYFEYIKYIKYIRVFHTDLAVGGDPSPPYGGGHMGGDRGPMGGDSRVIRDIIKIRQYY